MNPQFLFLVGIIFFFVISALPLYIAVKILGGKTTLIRTVIVMIVSGVLVSFSQSFGGIYGGLMAFILVLWLYRISFELGWIRAMFVWAGQFIVLTILYLISFVFLGVTVLGSFFI